MHRWGHTPQLTCKLKTRKDFLFISSELQALLQRVVVRQDVWSDHAVLEGHFRGSVHDVPRYIWKRPKDCQWPSLDVSDLQWPSQDLSPDDRYAAFWKCLEEAAVGQSADPIPKSALGRGKQVRIKTRCGVAHGPIAAGRPTDVQPLFHGISLKHAQWFRQLRRLQAFVRLSKSTRVSELGARSQFAWNSILRAKGFDPSFHEWWQQSQFRVATAPVDLPWLPPEACIASAIYESFHLAVRDLEKTLRSSCSSYARARRAAHPNAVFQDVKPLGPDSVNLLVQPLQANVEAIDRETFQVTLNKPCAWDDTKPIFCQGLSFQILHVESEWVWLNKVDGLVVGSTVTQVRMTGHIHDLCEAFRASWKERWMRHVDVPTTQWDTIVQFARDFLPRVQCPHVDLDPAAFKLELKHRRSKGAIGLDGVSLRDLQSLPDRAIQELCTFYAEAERSGRWPQQLLNGLVVSLAKSTQPASPLDYRPITILPVLYRLWGSHHAKSCLRALNEILPPDLYGSRPGCHATQVWSQLLWLIEQSQICGTTLVGLQCDIQKAFNHLPRLVVAEAAGAVGLSGKVLLAWAGALHQLDRFFLIRSSISCPVSSVTGFPEGCAMSCVGMLLVDFIYHQWFQQTLPKLTPISYVDDWQILGQSAPDISAALRELDKLCGHLDLLLDRRKTFAWALQSTDRQQLRALGVPVEWDGKVLGAHVQFTLRPTNKHLQARINTLHDLFDRLRASQSPYDAKLKAIRSAAWPRGLHGCLAASVSASTFAQLRTGAIRALQAEGSGVNPWIHLGMIENAQTDPAFWVICTSIRQIRECGAPEVVESLLATSSANEEFLPSNGVTQLLLTRLHWLGWGVNSVGWLVDSFGAFSLFDTCLEEVLARARRSWTYVVCSQVQHRVGMSTLHLADVQDTQDWLSLLSAHDKGLFRKILNGAIFTCDHQAKWDSDTAPECAFCQCTDGRFHRWWICEYLTTHRQSMTSDVHALLPVLPESLTCFGWSLLPNTMREWEQYLVDVPLPEVPCQGPIRGSIVDVFTDGTCAWSAEAKLRFGAWAAVAAPCDSLDAGPVICQGLLPGLIQTPYRAELFACYMVLRWAALHGLRIRLWIDCQSVLVRLTRLQKFATVPARNVPHADLWREIFLQLEALGDLAPVFTKVPAHTADAQSPDLFADWCRTHNGHAHRAAAVANHTRDPSFWELQQRHQQAVFAARTISRQVQQVQLQVSRALVLNDLSKHDAEPTPVREVVAEEPSDQWAPLPMSEISLSVQHKYGQALCKALVDWYRTCTAMSDTVLSWVSYYQLYVDFMGGCGQGGPILVESRWINPPESPEQEVVPYTFKQRCTWWARMLREVFRCMGGPLITQFGRPNSHMLCLHAGCCWVPWSKSRLESVEGWFSRWLIHPATRNGDSLFKIPASWGPNNLALQLEQH